MAQSYSAGGSRHAAVLTAIVGFHFCMFLLIAAGLGPPVFDAIRAKDPPPVKLLPPVEKPIEQSLPKDPRPYEFVVSPIPEPVLDIPDIRNDAVTEMSQEPARIEAAERAGAMPVVGERVAPQLKRNNDRLAALIASCYPAASRRAGEEGRAVVRLVVNGTGRAGAWRVTESTGFPRLDRAVHCIIERLEFAPGRQDGRAVEAEVLLPVVFRLD